MKKLFASLITVFAISQSMQAQAYEGKVEYQKNDEDAIVIEFPYPPSIVEGAMVEVMEKMGHRAKESKGFRTYKGISISEISGDNMDYMIRVERKSRRDKDESVVYLVMKTTGSNPLSVSESDIRQNAKNFLNNLTPKIEAYNLEQEIIAQEETVKKAEKKYANLRNDEEDLERKKKKIEDDLKENKKDQERQKQEVEKQKEVLEAMRNRRRA